MCSEQRFFLSFGFSFCLLHNLHKLYYFTYYHYYLHWFIVNNNIIHWLCALPVSAKKFTRTQARKNACKCVARNSTELKSGDACMLWSLENAFMAARWYVCVPHCWRACRYVVNAYKETHVRTHPNAHIDHKKCESSINKYLCTHLRACTCIHR